jgi:hypothetical protein
MNNSRELGGPGWSYRSRDRKERANQGSSQIQHGRLDAAMTVGTSGRTRRRLVVMEQAAEESQNQDGNNGKSHDWELSADAPFWMLQVHGVMQRESSTNFADCQFSRTELPLFTTIL